MDLALTDYKFTFNHNHRVNLSPDFSPDLETMEVLIGMGWRRRGGGGGIARVYPPCCVVCGSGEDMTVCMCRAYM